MFPCPLLLSFPHKPIQRRWHVHRTRQQESSLRFTEQILWSMHASKDLPTTEFMSQSGAHLSTICSFYIFLYFVSLGGHTRLCLEITPDSTIRDYTIYMMPGAKPRLIVCKCLPYPLLYLSGFQPALSKQSPCSFPYQKLLQKTLQVRKFWDTSTTFYLASLFFKLSLCCHDLMGPTEQQ